MVLAVGVAIVCALPTVLVLLLTQGGSTKAHRALSTACNPKSARSKCGRPLVRLGTKALLPFAATSIWNAPLADDAPLDPSSVRLVDAFVSQTRRYPVGIATSIGGVPIYTVPQNQPLEHVTLDESTAPLLQSAFNAVPLPADAAPAVGPDHTAVVWQPTADTLWEFWHFRRAADGFHAGFGGRMVDVSRSPGYYQDIMRGGSFVERRYWGAPATKVSLLGGLITIADLRSGTIDHALAVALPEVRAGVWSLPAQASDGTSTAADAIPEGARFRLPPDLDIDSLHLPSLARMMAVAAQRYGILVINSSTGVAFRAQDPTPTGRDPYYGTNGHPGDPADLFGGFPRVLLRSFPWERLQLLRMRLRS